MEIIIDSRISKNVIEIINPDLWKEAMSRMTLEQAAEKMYLKFQSMTIGQYIIPMPWSDLPELTTRAWKEIVRTCPVSYNRAGKIYRKKVWSLDPLTKK